MDMYSSHICNHHNQFRTYLLVVGDDLGDVSVHLVQLGVPGGDYPVPAASHRVHDVLSGERERIGKPCVTSLHTWMRAK